jgi:hypothetical protein
VSNFETAGFVQRGAHQGILEEAAFHRMVSLEQRRTIRTRRSPLLMLMGLGERASTKTADNSFHNKILGAVSTITRETDVSGWYREGSIVGVMFTEIAADDLSSATTTISNRLGRALRGCLTPQQFSQVNLSFHLLPETQDEPLAGAYAPAYAGIGTAGHISESSL